VEQDTDNDGFTFREEYFGKTNPDDASSHPPLAAKLSVVEVFNDKLNEVMLKRIGFPDNLDNLSEYEFFFKFTIVNGKKKTTRSVTAKYREPFVVEGSGTYEVVEVNRPASSDSKTLKKQT